MQHDQTAELNMRARIPLYLAGLGASCVGIAALNVVTADGGLSLLLSVLVAAGFCTSWAVRAGALTRETMSVALLVVLAPALAIMVAIPSSKYLLLPHDLSDTPELVLATLLAWLMVIQSFNLGTDKAVLFMCVPAISLIGLVSTFGANRDMITYFAVYLALTCFVLAEQNSLAASGDADLAVPRETHRAWLKWQAGVALGVAALALSMGAVLGGLCFPSLDRAFSDHVIAPTTAPVIKQFAEESFVPVAAGPVSQSQNEILLVRSEEALMWRGQTFNDYSGRGWSNSLSSDLETVIHPYPRYLEVQRDRRRYDQPSAVRIYEIPQDVEDRDHTAVKRVEQTFYHVIAGRSSIVFAAAEPDVVLLNKYGPIIKTGGGLKTGAYLSGGLSYKVISAVSTATPDQLRNAGDEYPEEVTRYYLSYPQSCRQVEAVTRRVTAGKTNAYDKAMAIKSHLERHYYYDANAPATPRNEDAVTNFLFKTERGYCDVFASAMVIMSRQAGIPARWVTGFDTGKYDKTQDVYRVRGTDGHAWAELYFPDHGWITFDPAPESVMDLSVLLRKRWQGIYEALMADKASLVIGALILILAGYLLKVEVVDRIVAAKRGTPVSMSPLANGAAEQYYRMCGIMSRFGFPKRPADTPLEYARELERVFRPGLPHISAALDSLTAAFVDCRYSGREPSDEEIDRMSNDLRNLLREMKDARRRDLLPQ